MKFKAKASGAASMLVLQQTAMTFSKASKSRYVGIHITPEHIYFLVLRSDRRQSDNLWVEIDQTHLFDVFVLQSLHANREILFRLQVDHLVKALTSAVESNNVTLKLTKRDHATCLTISIGSVRSHADQRIQALHSLVVSRWQRLVLPDQLSRTYQ
eukprot:TRINITY_DN11269_c0_g3_i2.p1 TRINITY_DN11269_c0_g3~~TRINITY_DN11269_c0_g3_i2.p1  ORF type:complete len:156 (+),score=0.50 TRINITY_DN11269_c0_g3_i2:174-641(+)